MANPNQFRHQRRRIACTCVGLLIFMSSAGAYCADNCMLWLIDRSNSDRFENRAACGGNRDAVGRGTVVIHTGGYIEISETETNNAGRTHIRCENNGTHAVGLHVDPTKSGSWPQRIALDSSCIWARNVLRCGSATEPSLICVSESIRPMRQAVTINAAVAMRSFGNPDTDKIRQWLDRHRPLVDFCRASTGQAPTAGVRLIFPRTGPVTLQTNVNAAPDATIGDYPRCIVDRLQRIPPPKDLVTEYTVEWLVNDE